MSNNRSISKLLAIMRDNIHLMDTFGLCFLTGMLLRNNILTKEKVKILRYFLSCNLPNDDMKYDTYYCWPKGEKEPRLDWINKQIQILEKQSV